MGAHKPDAAPYLDITYAKLPPVTSAAVSSLAPHVASRHIPHRAAIRRGATATATYSDGAYSIYGVSGSFASNCPLATSTACSAGNGGGLGVDAVSGLLGGSYVRAGVTLNCDSATPGYSWWHSNSTHLYYDSSHYANGGYADASNAGSIYDVMARAYQDSVIPIVNIRQDKTCASAFTSSAWYFGVANLIDNMQYYNNNRYAGETALPSTIPMIYFEIGNEENDGANAYGSFSNYATNFANAAQAVIDRGSHFSNYRILTGGMLQPTATVNQSSPGQQGTLSSKPCTDFAGQVNINEARQAIQAGVSKFGSTQAQAHLGVAVHPYKYDTSDTYYWRNYYTSYPAATSPPLGYQLNYNHYRGVCFDLGYMLHQWYDSVYLTVAGMPKMWTEDNYSDAPYSAETQSTCGDITGCEGTYLVDLMTWLYDKNWADPTTSPIRVAWFDGVDYYDQGTLQPFGIYSLDPSPGSQKFVTITACPQQTSAQGRNYVQDDYFYLTNWHCY